MVLQDTRKKTRFVTLFPETGWIHLLKDVGMIPYTMYKDFDYDASIVTYQNGDYPNLDNEVKGLKLEFLSRTNNDTKDGMEYLTNNARNIDILHLFHLSQRTFEWIDTYKKLNPNGKVYLKLDTTESIKGADQGFWNWVMSSLTKCHVVSAETLEVCKCLNDRWPIRVEYIANGVFECPKCLIDYQEKEDTILTVGRIGTHQKYNEVLLTAFKLAHTHMPNWKLKLLGPTPPEFQQVLTNYFLESPELKNKVTILGATADRSFINEEYKKAKIFCLTSRWEGFPLVFPEAAIHGCFIISSDLASARDITGNGKYGETFPIGDSQQLAKLMIKTSNDENKMRAICSDIQQFARDNFQWGRICQKLHLALSNQVPNNTKVGL